MRIAFFLLLTCSASLPAAGQDTARFALHDSILTLTYRGETIFSGALSSGTATRFSNQHTMVDSCSTTIATITSGDFSRFTLSGEILGSDEAIACESEPIDRGLRVVRNVSGASFSLLNNAVYDRKGDWLLSIDRFTPAVAVVPEAGPLPGRFGISVKNWEIVIRFRPDYYRRHRGLGFFHPSEYSVTTKPLAGWCSWFAYFDSVSERDVKRTADVLSSTLKPYGLDYLQIDDGYERLPIGVPSHWLVPNEKFPSGLGNLSAYISSKGLLPGIWTNVSFADSASAYADKELFVQEADGTPAFGNWVGYPMDGSERRAIDKFITPVYKTFREQGWRYFKLDALRHLKYEGYNAHAEYFDRKHADKNASLRNVVADVRRTIGPENVLLACWGIRPELVGLVDACRIGSDGFSYAGLAQYNSYNNIVWRNDPDHIVLSEKEAFRSCTATSLTGSLFMLTDKAEVYERSPLIEAAKRSIPVLFTRPGQVYDVDPSRSARIGLADLEMSGSGPRPFDASSSTTTGLFSLEVTRPYERWLVLGRVDERDAVLPLKELGLDGSKEYLVFEFWTKEFRGIAKGEFTPGPIDARYRCQVFCFRERQGHPQLLATNRHLSCGAPDVKDVQWDGTTLSGKCEVVGNDSYTLYLYEPSGEPSGAGIPAVSQRGGTLLKNEKAGPLRTITFLREKPGPIEWEIRY